MKAKILEALTTKFEGVSSSILDRIATKLAKTITKADDVATAVEGVTLQQVIEGYADSRANESAATARKKAVEEYETRYGLKDGTGHVVVAERIDNKTILIYDAQKGEYINFGALTADVDNIDFFASG